MAESSRRAITELQLRVLAYEWLCLHREFDTISFRIDVSEEGAVEMMVFKTPAAEPPPHSQG